MEERLYALRQMLLQLRELLAGVDLPDGHTARASELVIAAMPAQSSWIAR